MEELQLEAGDFVASADSSDTETAWSVETIWRGR
jgi:hypothetical protein